MSDDLRSVFDHRFSGLRDDDFFALGNPIEELNNVYGGFDDVGNHSSPRNSDFIIARCPSELRMVNVENFSSISRKLYDEVKANSWRTR